MRGLRAGTAAAGRSATRDGHQPARRQSEPVDLSRGRAARGRSVRSRERLSGHLVVGADQGRPAGRRRQSVAAHPDGAEAACLPRDITDAEVQGQRTINFASTPPFGAQHTINGKKFDGFENAQKVFLNTVEEWTITNATAKPNISHPFHIHVNPF
jgi:FtsP/CotA-like multicopper oxidase with cupredoxin domain